MSMFIYVISRVESDGPVAPVKLGITSNLRSRLQSIQTACSHRIELIHALSAPDRAFAGYIERLFHGRHKNDRLHGEWFSLGPQQALDSLCLGTLVALRADGSLNEPELYEFCRRMGFPERGYAFIFPVFAPVFGWQKPASLPESEWADILEAGQ